MGRGNQGARWVEAVRIGHGWVHTWWNITCVWLTPKRRGRRGHLGVACTGYLPLHLLDARLL